MYVFAYVVHIFFSMPEVFDWGFFQEDEHFAGNQRVFTTILFFWHKSQNRSWSFINPLAIVQRSTVNCRIHLTQRGGKKKKPDVCCLTSAGLRTSVAGKRQSCLTKSGLTFGSP